MSQSPEHLELDVRRKALEAKLHKSQTRLEGRGKALRGELKSRLSLSETVKRHPLLALGVMLGAGFLVGRLLFTPSRAATTVAKSAALGLAKKGAASIAKQVLQSGNAAEPSASVSFAHDLKNELFGKLKAATIGFVSSFVLNKAQDYMKTFAEKTLSDLSEANTPETNSSEIKS
jgi:hypothetical protein